MADLTQNRAVWVEDYTLNHVRRDRLAGLRIQVRHRIESAINHLISTGSINRADLERIGEVSTPQASADIQLILTRFPGLMAYDRSAKCYVLAPAAPLPPAPEVGR